ncbi:MAG: N-acetyl sugar amidotransferase [Thermoplasmatota archaeon]
MAPLQVLDVASASADQGIRTCVRCVMDTTDARISFDAAGFCDHCRTYDAAIWPKWRGGEGHDAERTAWLREIKRRGEGRDFDCIIGMSGGADSSYLLWKAKEDFGLRPLVFHVDAGWNSQEATNNIERLVDGLGVDLHTEVIDWGEMRDLQLAFFKAGVPHIDAPQDHAFFATMYRYARRHRVRAILTGANYSTECIRNPVEWMYYQSDGRQLRDIHRRFGSRPLRTFPTTSILRHKVYLPYVRGIRIHRPLNLIPYHKAAAMRDLADRFGWQPYPQKHFESRFTRFYEGYWLPGRFGYDTRKVQFSSLILTGQMTRGDALRRLEEPALDDAAVAREKEYVANKLSITQDELESYFSAPRKTYRDYRSQAWMYAWGARAAATLGLERGGKR